MIVHLRLFIWLILVFGANIYGITQDSTSMDFALDLAKKAKSIAEDNPDLAIEYLHKTTDIFQKNESLNQWLNNHFAIIYYLYNYLGEHQLARVWADSIITHPFNQPQTSNDHKYHGYILSFSARRHKDLEDFDKAEKLLSLTKEHLEKANFSTEAIQSIIFSVLGDISNKRSEPSKAIFYYQTFIGASNILGKWDDVVSGYNGLAVVYHNLGEYQKELANYRKGLEVNNASEKAYADIYFNMGDRYRWLKNFDSALIATNYAIDQFEQFAQSNPAQNQLSDLVRGLTLKGAIYLDMGKYDESIGVLSEALLVALSMEEAFQPPELANIYATWAQAEGRKGNFERGLRYVQKALFFRFDRIDSTNTNSNPAPNTIKRDLLDLDILWHKAALFLKDYERNGGLTKLEKALECIEITNQIIQHSQKEYDYEPSKMLIARESMNYQEVGIDAALKLYQETQNKSYLHKAFSFSERSKGMVLKESVQNITAWDMTDLTDEIKEKENNLRQQLTSHEAMLAEFQNNGDSVNIKKWESKLFQAKQVYNQLIREIEEKYPEYYQLKYQRDSVSIPQLQNYLRKNKAIAIEYFWGKEALHVFGISADDICAYSIDFDTTRISSEILDFVTKLGDSGNKVKGRNLKAFNRFIKQSHSIYQQILAPVFGKLSGDRYQSMIIIPGGILGYLPFEVLLTEEGRYEKVKYSDLSYLLKKYRIRYDFSSNLLLNYSEKKLPRRFAYGGFAPTYENNFEIGPWKLSALANNQKEVTKAAKIMEGESYIGSLATKERFQEVANQYNILHLAMHALMDDKDPRKSGLAFFQEGSDQNFPDSLRSLGNETVYTKSFLHTFDIYNLRIAADLVVLSACNTGKGKVAQGEGIMSLARAFAYAGCPSVVMSLWQVDDEMTEVLMRYYFENLKKGMAKDEALRQAKLTYLKTQDYDHPFYWASFVQTGNATPFKSGLALYHYLFILGGLIILLSWGRRFIK